MFDFDINWSWMGGKQHPNCRENQAQHHQEMVRIVYQICRVVETVTHLVISLQKCFIFVKWIVITRPLMSLKRGNSVKTSVDFSSSRTILVRYWNVSFILCLIAASSEECFKKDMASLHWSSLRVISGLNETSLLAVGPPPVSWRDDPLLSVEALFLWIVLSLHAK